MQEIIKWFTENKTLLIILAVAAALVVIGILVAVHRHRRKRSAKGKIFKTTDGFLGNYPTNKKSRRVAAVDQRKTDGAVAVVKIYKKRGKEEKIGKTYIPDLELTPEKHSSLTEVSIVGRQVIFGVREGDTFRPILTRNLEATGDKLTRGELRKIQKEVQNYCKRYRKTYERKRRKWHKGFKK